MLVDVIGMEANATVELRRELRQKNIQIAVVKNSLARRATEGTPLAPAFEGAKGRWPSSGERKTSSRSPKRLSRIAGDKKYEPFAAKGGAMDGSPLSADQVKDVSKWPSRTEQLSLLMGQILSPGATLSAQLLGPGRMVASQIKQKGEEDE